jgi:predicted HD phosphohydrolase
MKRFRFWARNRGGERSEAGVDRRGFLAASAGAVTTLAVAGQLGGCGATEGGARPPGSIGPAGPGGGGGGGAGGGGVGWGPATSWPWSGGPVDPGPDPVDCPCADPRQLYDPNDPGQVFDAPKSFDFGVPAAPPGARATFTRMDQGTFFDWLQIGIATGERQSAVPPTIMNMLRALEGFHVGFGLDQLQHALQTATRAKRANASDEMVLAALLHDVGKVISIEGHAEVAAGILHSYVAEDVYQVVRSHEDFKGSHTNKYLCRSDLRQQYRSASWFAQAEKFTDEWDQAAFDPSYSSMPLAEFQPLVEQFFSRSEWSPPKVCG